MRKHVFIFSVLLLLSGLVNAQSRTITGTVRDAHDKLPLPGVNVLLRGTTMGVITDANGVYQIKVPNNNGILVFSYIGYETVEKRVTNRSVINVALKAEVSALEEVVIRGYATKKKRQLSYSVAEHALQGKAAGVTIAPYSDAPYVEYNTEEYAAIHENTFLEPTKNPLSTFSIDVDAASYSNVRRFLNNAQNPPKDAVRIEELVNYFHYDYEEPEGEDPFSINTEISVAPWNKEHKLIHIGLQGKHIPTENLPPSNLVFLLDVSGSMNAPNKLPLLKSSFKLLVEQLREQDNVAIVVYAGAAGMVLPSTPGHKKEKIMAALDKLSAGGSTAGGAGIRLAYNIAKEHFKEGGNNRVILATDGDFNVGASSNAAMERLIEKKRAEGIFLTVLGFGMGNYKDSKMEILANKGNGNYAYIDHILEAKKVLVNEFGGTLFTIAKDVKLQIEFNPAKVKAYRLIGYENRKLQDEDFNNDKKDAGDLGSGHTVTALYEIIPAGNESYEFIQPVDDLKYQQNRINKKTTQSNEIMTLKLRYKQPDGDKSKLLVEAVKDDDIELHRTTDNFRFSAAVAQFGMLLRDSEFKGKASYADVISLARSARGDDKEGYRAEFIKMVETMALLASK
ncbi:von Willebrand factor type A domain-containing protein [Fulvivirgaceae bacterium BMA10]|uniref:von Willebrand factor type A domain-containing protein n=1 Tax=Splendidivirga corallicola TaxID=3051826 RepID=A0ABT8KVA0_9BACT|nr:von Willebrand factor type A domain-containing protein [Fulvivirgaceae bacterium BMA10]